MPIFLARFLPVAGRIYVDFLTRNSGRCAAIHVDACELHHLLHDGTESPHWHSPFMSTGREGTFESKVTKVGAAGARA